MHYQFLINNSINYFGDTSLLLSHVQSIKEEQGWATNYLASNIQALQNSTQSALYWCENIIGATPIDIRGGLAEHAYLYLAILGGLSRFWQLDGIQTYMGAITVAHLMPIIYIAYISRVYKIRSTKIFIIGIALYSNIIILNMLWAQPHIEQLVYVFLPPFIYFLFNRFLLNETYKRNYLKIVLYGLLTLAISERVSLIAGLITLSSCSYALFRKHFKSTDFFILTIGCTQIGWFFYWRYSFADSFYYSGISAQALWQNFLNLLSLEMRAHTLIFILVNILTLLIISQLKIYSLWMLLAFVPNLLITVGGAEKDTFAISQYHSLYIVTSITIFILVSINSTNFSVGIARHTTKVFRSQVLLANSIFLAFSIPILNSSYLSYSAPAIPIRILKVLNPISSANDSQSKIPLTLSNLDRSVVISAPEDITMGFAREGFYNLRYYPVGLLDSELVIAPILSSDTTEAVILGLPTWFQSEVQSRELGSCVKTYLQTNRFRVIQVFEYKTKTFVAYMKN